MKEGNILIIDDNSSILTTLEMLLTGHFKQIITLKKPNHILSYITQYDIEVILLDMNFSAGINTGNEGVFWLNQIIEKFPHISVIMITAYGDIDLAVRTIKNGAFDFILKPWNNEKVISTTHAALKLSQSQRKNQSLKKESERLKAACNQQEEEIIGRSTAMKEVIKIAQKIAGTDANILITGENGTGKEVFAKYIHTLSQRRNSLIVTVDMGAISSTLFESELFGHTRGSFTGATKDRMGKMEAAHEGTLFLDEIGNLSMDLQAKLLSVIQTKTITKLGSNDPKPLDIRLICATNINIPTQIANQQFREDLFYRINTIQIELPPLRDRGHDIILLANNFLNIFGLKYNKSHLHLSTKVQKQILDYGWPGNIRELKHCMEKAAILADKPQIDHVDLQTYHANTQDDLKLLDLDLDQLEKKIISQQLEAEDGNMSKVATKLGVTRQTLYNKLKKHNL
ncbi:sigma-54 dependent transcriptional regulator [Halosquirtibacter laminarini]|uniref:Sigma-54 dependent transcriptional regulator n=1 Tax=Halosquirtibacter laminarini TaxID=3374600 RepID=A0AC61NH23_9BACT|nr:sigma-54 dependent transcriptional regulator [Prolixibacteraceae bacterium]